MIAAEERTTADPSKTESGADFHRNPFIVIWETTRACALKCLHCRAEAVDRRDPNELSTAEGYSLLEEVRRFGKVTVVLTGGDPMRRADALWLVEYGTDLGLRMTMTPSGTGEMSFEKVEALKERGLSRLAVSLDGPSADVHDAFRGTPGSFQWTLDILRWAAEVNLPVQINTTVGRHNLDRWERMAYFVRRFDPVLWSVFFLVPVGRAKKEDLLGAREFEEVFHRMADLSARLGMDVKSTEAPQFRRVVLERRKASPAAPEPRRSGIRAPYAVNDGKGFVFISHTGEIYPSGFLPVTAGNVRTASLVDVYRDSPLFRDLRDPDKLKGKCGRCEYRRLCGGSRSRAYAIFGDPLAADPYCVHVPAGYTVSEEERAFW